MEYNPVNGVPLLSSLPYRTYDYYPWLADERLITFHDACDGNGCNECYHGLYAIVSYCTAPGCPSPHWVYVDRGGGLYT